MRYDEVPPYERFGQPVSARATHVIDAEGIETLEQLTELLSRDGGWYIKTMPNIGKVTIKELKALVATGR